MISVPSHLPPSSGNRFLLTILGVMLLLISCSSATTAPARPTVIKPNTSTSSGSGSSDESEVTVDTVQWTFADPEVHPPITGSSAVASYALEKVDKGAYRIALMLPMRLEQSIPSLDANNKKFAEFYAGIQMAGDRALRPQVSVDVYYTNRDKTKMSSIIGQMERSQPDVIIAPYESDLISMAADYARDKRITIISPWKSSKKITEENLFYLQMRPSIEHYYARLLEHVKYNYEDEEIRIIQKDNGKDRLKIRLLQEINEENAGLPIVTPLETYDVAMDSLMDSEALVFDSLLTMGVKAFVLPHYSSRDESFAYSCLRKMYAEKLDRDFSIYTMPLVLNSDRVDINILKNLDIRAAEFRFPDAKSPEVQAFQKAYLDRYGWIPTEDAYYGYDLMTFIMNGLAEHGQYFHYYMAGQDVSLMQMKVHIQPFYKEAKEGRPDFLVNDHLYIIEFDQDHFKIKDIR